MFAEYVCRTYILNIYVYVHTDGVLSTLEPYVTKSQVDTILFSTYWWFKIWDSDFSYQHVIVNRENSV